MPFTPTPAGQKKDPGEAPGRAGWRGFQRAAGRWVRGLKSNRVLVQAQKAGLYARAILVSIHRQAQDERKSPVLGGPFDNAQGKLVGPRRGCGRESRTRQLLREMRLPRAALARDSRGTMLLEAVIGITVFSMVGVAVMVGMSTTHTTGDRVEGQSVAENIARNQMEDLFASPYKQPPDTYDSIAVPPGYSVTAEAEVEIPGDLNISRIVVTITRHGQEVLVLETLRTE